MFGSKNAEIQYVCNKSVKTPVIEKNATFDSKDGVYKVRIQHQEFCVDDDDDDDDDDGSGNGGKKLSGGAIFLIVLAVVVVAYLVVGTVVESVRNKAFTLPNKAFWVEFGLCIKEACVHMCSCSKSEGLMKSTYDKI